MIRCLIVDDEELARVEMSALLSEHPEVCIAGEAATIDHAFALCLSARPALVFLDIQLRGESGFDLVDRLDASTQARPLIVFVSAHDNHAIRAFEKNAFDYLLKPVHPSRLAETLKRVPSRGIIEPLPAAAPSSVVKTGSDHQTVAWTDIQSIESEGNYTLLSLADGSTSLVHRPLKEWADTAPAGHFIQVHRSALVFSPAIREVRRRSADRREIVMENGRIIPVGRAFWPNLKSVFT